MSETKPYEPASTADYVRYLMDEAAEQNIDPLRHVVHVVAGNMDAGNYAGTEGDAVNVLMDALDRIPHPPTPNPRSADHGVVVHRLSNENYTLSYRGCRMGLVQGDGRNWDALVGVPGTRNFTRKDHLQCVAQREEQALGVGVRSAFRALEYAKANENPPDRISVPESRASVRELRRATKLHELLDIVFQDVNCVFAFPQHYTFDYEVWHKPQPGSTVVNLPGVVIAMSLNAGAEERSADDYDDEDICRKLHAIHAMQDFDFDEALRCLSLPPLNEDIVNDHAVDMAIADSRGLKYRKFETSAGFVALVKALRRINETLTELGV